MGSSIKDVRIEGGTDQMRTIADRGGGGVWSKADVRKKI